MSDRFYRYYLREDRQWEDLEKKIGAKTTDLRSNQKEHCGKCKVVSGLKDWFKKLFRRGK